MIQNKGVAKPVVRTFGCLAALVLPSLIVSGLPVADARGAFNGEYPGDPLVPLPPILSAQPTQGQWQVALYSGGSLTYIDGFIFPGGTCPSADANGFYGGSYNIHSSDGTRGFFHQVGIMAFGSDNCNSHFWFYCHDEAAQSDVQCWIYNHSKADVLLDYGVAIERLASCDGGSDVSEWTLYAGRAAVPMTTTVGGCTSIAAYAMHEWVELPEGSSSASDSVPFTHILQTNWAGTGFGFSSPGTQDLSGLTERSTEHSAGTSQYHAAPSSWLASEGPSCDGICLGDGP